MRVDRERPGVIIRWKHIFVIFVAYAYYQYHIYQQAVSKTRVKQSGAKKLLSDKGDKRHAASADAAGDAAVGGVSIRPWTEEDKTRILELNKQAPEGHYWKIEIGDAESKKFGYVFELREEESQIIGFVEYEWLRTGVISDSARGDSQEHEPGEEDGEGEQDGDSSSSSSLNMKAMANRARVGDERIGEQVWEEKTDETRAEYDPQHETVEPVIIDVRDYDPNIDWYIFDHDPKGKLEASTVVFITKLLINEGHRGKGFALASMKQFMAKFPEQTKFALHCVTDMIGFYEQLGFKVIKELTGQYGIVSEMHKYE